MCYRRLSAGELYISNFEAERHMVLPHLKQFTTPPDRQVLEFRSHILT
jgi:hypothetical protein